MVAAGHAGVEAGDYVDPESRDLHARQVDVGGELDGTQQRLILKRVPVFPATLPEHMEGGSATFGVSTPVRVGRPVSGLVCDEQREHQAGWCWPGPCWLPGW